LPLLATIEAINGERSMLIDINGDGLPDRVFDKNPSNDQPGFYDKGLGVLGFHDKGLGVLGFHDKGIGVLGFHDKGIGVLCFCDKGLGTNTFIMET
jgi:hypothetical protein